MTTISSNSLYNYFSSFFLPFFVSSSSFPFLLGYFLYIQLYRMLYMILYKYYMTQTERDSNTIRFYRNFSFELAEQKITRMNMALEQLWGEIIVSSTKVQSLLVVGVVNTGRLYKLVQAFFYQQNIWSCKYIYKYINICIYMYRKEEKLHLPFKVVCESVCLLRCLDWWHDFKTDTQEHNFRLQIVCY